jgi:hypothetical protein
MKVNANNMTHLGRQAMTRRPVVERDLAQLAVFTIKVKSIPKSYSELYLAMRFVAVKDSSQCSIIITLAAVGPILFNNNMRQLKYVYVKEYFLDQNSILALQAKTNDPINSPCSDGIFFFFK